MNLSELLVPFQPDDIEWRVQRYGVKNDKPWAFVIPYIQNRAIMDRLDTVCGPENWRNEFKDWHGSKSCLCGISIKTGDEWVTKWDGADDTDIESVKGGLSNAMKRAAVQWGIGRYLYSCGGGWAVFSDKGKYDAKIDNHYYHWDPPGLVNKVSGEVIEPQNTIPAQNKSSDLITPAQRKKLMADLTRLGINKAEAKDFIGYCLSRTISSSSDITKEEASQLLDEIDNTGAIIRDRYRGYSTKSSDADDNQEPLPF